jgi:Cu(I)/Ag(I) efflux system membrane fusion protein
MNKRTMMTATLILTLSILIGACKTRQAGDPGVEAGEETLSPTVTLNDDAMKIADINVQTARLESLPLKVRAAGEVAFNQKRYFHVTARISGRVEEITAYPGDRVKAGQVLLTLYSPEFLASRAELVQARIQRDNALKHGTSEEAAQAEAIFGSARNKLLLCGLTDEDLKAVEDTRTPQILVPVRAPSSGTVIDSPVVRGDYVETGASLFRTADLSLLWVLVHIFEKDLAGIGPGCEAAVRVQAYPGREFKGRLALIEPALDGKTRTVVCRVETPNAEGLLKPGMYADVVLTSTSKREAVLIPEDAVQDLENKKVIFIPAGQNTFAWREVGTGGLVEGRLEIVGGLTADEAFVAEGAFLLKSELLKKSLEVE